VSIVGYFNLDGTTYRSDKVFPGADRTIHILQRTGKKNRASFRLTAFLRKAYAQKFWASGSPAREEEAITSSWMLTRELTREVPGIKVFAISEDHLSEAPFGLDTQGEQKSLDVYVEVIGPDKRLIEATPLLVDWARALRLLMHPWNFRADSLPTRYNPLEEEIDFFNYEVNGMFTDPPGPGCLATYACLSGKEK